MAEREIYRLEINVSTDGVEGSKKKLSSMDKFVEGSEKRLKQLDRLETNPAIELQDKLTSPLKKMESKVGSFAKTAIKRFTAIAAAGAVLVGGFGLKDTMSTFMDFEQGLSSVQAVSQATTEEMKLLKDEAKRLGAETEWSAVQITEAETLLAQAGFSVQENIAALPGLLDLASAGSIELAEATDIAAGTLKAFGLEADQAGHVADVLAVASSATNSDVTGLGESMKYVGPAAKAMGVDMEQATAALGMLANANIKGSQAGTTLRSALTRLAKPTKQSADMMKQLGFNAFDTEGKMLPMHEVIRNLEQSTAGLTDQQKANAMATIFGQEAMSGMLALVEQGPDALEELTNSLYDSQGAAKEMADTRLDNLAGQMTILKSAVEGMKIELGERLAPYAKEFVEWLTPKIPIITEKIVELVDKAVDFGKKAYPEIKKFIDGAKELLPKLEPLIPVIAGIASAIVAIKIGNKISSGVTKVLELKSAFGAVMTGASGFKAALGALMGPVGWVALAIGAVVAIGVALWKNWDTIKEKAAQLGSWISDKWNGLKEKTSEAWDNVKSTVSEKWGSLKETVKGAGPAIVDGVTNTWSKVKEGTLSRWDSIKEGTSSKVSDLKDFITDKFFSLPDSVLGPLGDMKAAIERIFGGIKQFFSGYWEVIKNIFGGALLILTDLITLDFENIGNHISQIWDNIKEGLGMMWEGIKEIFSGALDYIKAYSELVWNSIKEGITLVWTTVKEWLVETWESIKESAVEGWNSLKESVSNIISSTGEWIKTTWDGIVEWFTTLPARLYEKGTEMFEQLREGMASLKDSIVEKSKEIGTAIVDKVKELPSQMLTIGKDIVQGLINGLGQKLGALRDKAQEVASAIGDKVKGFLGIKSPSRLMMEYGGYTTEGLAIGMENKMPKLEAVVGTTYEVIAREDLKNERLSRGGFGERVANVAQKLNPFRDSDDPDNPGKPRLKPTPVAVAGGGGATYNIYIDDIDVDISGGEDGEDVETVVEKAQEEFGRKLLQAIKDKK